MVRLSGGYGINRDRDVKEVTRLRCSINYVSPVGKRVRAISEMKSTDLRNLSNSNDDSDNGSHAIWRFSRPKRRKECCTRRDSVAQRMSLHNSAN